MNRPEAATTGGAKGGGYMKAESGEGREPGGPGNHAQPAVTASMGGGAAAGALGTRHAVLDWGNAVALALATGLGASLLLAAAVIALSMGAG